MVIHEDSFLPPYPYECYCILIGRIPEVLEDVSSYDYSVGDSQPMKAIRNKTKHSSTTKKSDRPNQKRGQEWGSQGGSGELVTNKADTILVRKRTAASFPSFNVNKFQEENLFLNFKYIKNWNIPILDVILWYVSILRASFDVYGFNCPSGTLSMPFHSVARAECVSTLWKDSMLTSLQSIYIVA